MIFALALCTTLLQAQMEGHWPREIPLDNGGKVVIYQPQPEHYSGNQLEARAAVQVKKSATAEPVFGALWVEARVSTNRDTRMMSLETVKVRDVRFPDTLETAQIDALKQLLETEIPKWELEFSLDELLATLEQERNNGSDALGTDPPKIYYVTRPTTLVLIDGDPQIGMDEHMQMERVLNSPFLIVREGALYYLYAGGFWHQSANILSGWSDAGKLPKSIRKLDDAIKKQEKEDNEGEQPKNLSKTPTAILVSTTPAEILQTEGEAQFKAIAGTQLLYVSNTDDQVFKDIGTQNNYILLSGRWYKGPSLDGPWTFVPADKLPEDFSKIPEGSEKDGVLASVAGTQASKEAVMDAQIPQTAKVERNAASTSVTYDGLPKFEPIEGTNLFLAVNSPQTVLRANNRYYTVDNGIWFVSDNANGPWAVSEVRPADVDRIPPDCQAYHVKYVYIYDYSPDFVYVGYTPGYLGSYIYGPTIVYGTGYYYHPWHGHWYYPRPWTWGWGIHYNPWYGWNFGWRYQWHFSWYQVYWGNGYWGGGYWGGGWFGPPAYRPPCRPVGWHGGYYGPRTGGPTYGTGKPSIYRPRPTNNIYNKRQGVTTKVPQPSYRPTQSGADGRIPITRPSAPSDGRQPSPRPSATPAKPDTRPTTRPSQEPNNVATDKKGEVYQRDPNGNWNQRKDKTWKPAPGNSGEQMNRTQQQRDRGNTRQDNFKRGQQTKTTPPKTINKAGSGRKGR